jgi:hypothetical protein
MFISNPKYPYSKESRLRRYEMLCAVVQVSEKSKESVDVFTFFNPITLSCAKHIVYEGINTTSPPSFFFFPHHILNPFFPKTL